MTAPRRPGCSGSQAPAGAAAGAALAETCDSDLVLLVWYCSWPAPLGFCDTASVQTVCHSGWHCLAASVFKLQSSSRGHESQWPFLGLLLGSTCPSPRLRVTVLQALDLSSGSEPPADRATVASPGRRRTAGRPVSTFGASPPASPDPVGILEPVRTLDRTSLWPRRLRDGEMGVSASNIMKHCPIHWEIIELSLC